LAARSLAGVLLLLSLSGLLLVALARPAVGAAAPVIVGRVTGVIDASTVDYVKSLLETAAEQGSPLVVLELNTPGGSLDVALEIAVALRRSPVPVVGYVVDHWAMSAGTLILMCSHVAAMQPGTLIGAVQPVIVTPEGGFRPVNESKILNPVYKEIELCMRMHGRNATLARLFVYRNLVLTAEEALRLHAVDAVVPTLPQLLGKINGTVVTGVWGSRRLVIPSGSVVEYVPMPAALRLAHMLSDPLVSSLLTSFAMLIILLALASGHPHLAVLGIGLLLLGLLGIGSSVSLVALALMLIGFILLVVELVAIPGFGAVGLTGILLIVVGALVTFSGHPVYIAGESLRAALYVLLAVVAPLAGFMGVAVYKVVRTWRQPPVYQPTPVGKTGRALDDLPPGAGGFVMVEGEYWEARNVSEKPIRRGEKVRVIGKDGSVLLVEPLGEEAAE
jgi:membrane-bound serine protease (ClpP class)